MSTLLRVDPESLPRNLVLDPPLTDAEFEAFCRNNENVQLERTKEGVIRMNPPVGGLTGDGNAEIIRQLRNWWMGHRQGRVFDSNTGFYLPDSSMLSPDAAYIGSERLKGVTKAELTGFPRLCPDFLIELLSESDSVAKAKNKMDLWIDNGASLGWLVRPYEQKVYVYQPGLKVSAVSGKSVSGVGPVKGFTLNLEEVWRCYDV